MTINKDADARRAEALLASDLGPAIRHLVLQSTRQTASKKGSGTVTFVKLLFMTALIFAEAALVMLFVHVLHDWSDRVPTIGYGRAVVLVALGSVWVTLRSVKRDVSAFATDRR